jgi:AcrR family transcriptional regulator
MTLRTAMQQTKTARRKSADSQDAKDVKRYDVDVLTRIDRVTAPKQARSERSFQRTLHALETLLESKAFIEISIPEIAKAAECGVAAIYARFRDKNSILAALHESMRERMVQNIEKALTSRKTDNASFEDCIQRFCAGLVRHYASQRNLLAAALMLGDAEIYDRAASTIRLCSELLAANLRAHSLRSVSADFDTRVFQATAATFALLQQRALFHPACPSMRERNTDRDFIGELVLLFHRCIGFDTAR